MKSKSSQYSKLSVLALTLLLAGCSYIPSVGPDYEKPQDPENLSWDQQILQDGTAFFDFNNPSLEKNFWNQFQDPLLTELVTAALKNNPSKERAAAFIKESRAQVGIASSAFFPMISGIYTANRQGIAGNNNLIGGAGSSGINTGTGTGTPVAASGRSGRILNSYRAGFDAGWEIDIFGGDRRNLEAAQASEDAAVASYDGVTLSLVSEIVSNYIELRQFQKRYSLAEKNIGLQDENAQLVKVKFDAGLSSELDFAQATSQVETSRAVLPQLRAELLRRMYALAVLCGQEPNAFADKLALPETTDIKIPHLDQKISLTQPTDILRNRPDVRQAERTLAASTALKGVAIAELFPKFNLTGFFGVSSLASHNLFESASKTWSAGAAASLPIFQGGRNWYGIKTADAQLEQSLNTYRETVLASLEEAQNALNAYRFEHERYESLKKAFNASKRSFELSQALYKEGLVDFIRVLDAQRALFTAEDTLTQSDATLTLSAIALYKAFGGPVDESIVEEKKA